MIFGKKQNDLVQSVAKLQDADYSKQPALGEIYSRISDGRVSFEKAFSNSMTAQLGMQTSGIFNKGTKIMPMRIFSTKIGI